MKKLATLAVIATAILSACNGGKLREAEAQNEQLKGDLCETLATQDSLLVLVNDISDGMNQIKDLEKIISTPGSLGESVSRRDQIKNDMIAIQKALQERRERLAELEKKLADNPSLSTRLYAGKSPVKVVLDRRRRVGPEAGIFKGDIPVIMMSDYGSLGDAMSELYRKGITSVLVEGGAQVLESFMKEDLWDEIRVEISPECINGRVKAPDLIRLPFVIDSETVDGHRIITYRN